MINREMFPNIFYILKLITIETLLCEALNYSSEAYLKELEQQCGNQASYKIMNGELTAIDEFPWMALLEYKDNTTGKSIGFGCSGSLISKKHVLTTAHCIKELEKRQMQLFSVRLGEYNISSEEDCVEMMGFQDCTDPPQDIPVEKWIVYPKHNKHIHDVALIQLRKEAQYNDFVLPICLPFSNYTEEVGQLLTVAGWGRTENENTSSVKLKVNVPVVSYNDCYRKYETANTILNSSQHLCAGSVLGKDACTGDSGGPLMTSLRNEGKWIIAGIISTGNSCGLPGWPGIYVRVAYYREWILQHLQND